MNRFFYPAKALFLGLFSAQILASVQVYLSNSSFYQFLSAIKNAGYFPIPNELIMRGLMGFNPAFFGGLFFTLSVGAGLSISGITAALIWDRLFSRKRYLLILFLLLWLATILAVNFFGFCLMYTSYFLIIPAVVFMTTLRWMPTKAKQNIGLNRIIHAGSIILLTLLWIPQFSNDIFLDFRDNFLLSNVLGEKVNSFYYKYTLYPAEVFKSLDQRLLKSCSLKDIKKKSLPRLLEKELLNHDYLSLPRDVQVDLKIIEHGDLLIFKNGDSAILKLTPGEFFSRPGLALKEFSLKTDRHIFFRHFTFFSILVGLPITLYIILYALLRFVSCLFINLRSSSLIASILCLILGIAAVIPFYLAASDITTTDDIAKALESDRWQDRVTALKTITSQRLETGDFRTYHRLKTSPYIPERYWLARALGVSRQPETYNDLLDLLDDPHPNVVCMALYALGQRGNKTAVNKIMAMIKSSDDWYKQDYAYRALRKLGWVQTKSG